MRMGHKTKPKKTNKKTQMVNEFVGMAARMLEAPSNESLASALACWIHDRLSWSRGLSGACASETAINHEDRPVFSPIDIRAAVDAVEQGKSMAVYVKSSSSIPCFFLQRIDRTFFPFRLPASRNYRA